MANLTELLVLRKIVRHHLSMLAKYTKVRKHSSCRD